VIYNGVHMYLAQNAVAGDFGPWRNAIDKVQALKRAKNSNRPTDLQDLGEVFTFRAELGKRGLAGGLPTG
jgi:hypothetical protein